MSNEWNDWCRDADDSDVITCYERCIDNRWMRESNLYKSELIRRGMWDEKTETVINPYVA